jgi:hypothetical protein
MTKARLDNLTAPAISWREQPGKAERFFNMIICHSQEERHQ